MHFGIVLIWAAIVGSPVETPLTSASASEAAIDAFVTVLPPRSASDESARIESEIGELLRVNRGREAQVRAIFDEKLRCEAPIQERALGKGLRQSARRLGDEKLKRMTEFYRRGEHKLFAQLLERKEGQETLAPADQNELDRIEREYPVWDYVKSSRMAEADMFSDAEFVQGVLECEEAFTSAVAAAGLKR